MIALYLNSLLLQNDNNIFIYIILLTTISFFLYYKIKKNFQSSNPFLKIIIPSVFFLEISLICISSIVGLIEEKTKEKLLGYAPHFATVFRNLNYDSINLNTSENDEKYLQLIKLEKEWLLDSFFINDIYTMEKDINGKIHLIVDSETDYNRDGNYDGENESRTNIGETYEKILPELNLAFEGKSTFTSSPYSDKWGNWVSAFVPIYDKNGRQKGIMGVDFKAEEYLQTINTYINSGLFVSLLLYLLLAALYYIYLVAKMNIQIKDQFTSKMGHELRTPLNGILGVIEIIQNSKEQISSNKLQDYYNIISQSANGLLSVVNDILDFSKVQSENFKINNKPSDLKLIISETSNLVSILARNKKLTFETSFPEDFNELVLIDEGKIRQVLLNLLSNSIKFTDAGKIFLGIKIDKIDVNNIQCNILVEDSGIGMDEAFMKRLFTPFLQNEKLNIKVNQFGTGLGLVVCKEMIEIMGGSITVTSEVGVGTKFTIKLQLEIVSKIASNDVIDINNLNNFSSQEKIKNILMTKKVLIVDDVQINQIILKKIFEKFDLQCVCFFNPEKALLEINQNNNFDFVITDYHMQEMNGIEFISKIAKTNNTIFILSSADSLDIAEINKFKNEGIDDFLPKPVSSKSVEALIEKYKNLSVSSNESIDPKFNKQSNF